MKTAPTNELESLKVEPRFVCLELFPRLRLTVLDLLKDRLNRRATLRSLLQRLSQLWPKLRSTADMKQRPNLDPTINRCQMDGSSR